MDTINKHANQTLHVNSFTETDDRIFRPLTVDQATRSAQGRAVLTAILATHFLLYICQKFSKAVCPSPADWLRIIA